MSKFKATCLPFEIADHRYKKLDSVGGIIGRLYCEHCGRVIYTAVREFGIAYVDELPKGVEPGGPGIKVRHDA